jgi:hypothetical protein
MAVRIGPRLDAFLGEVMPAIIGTRRTDGSVQINPVWFEYKDGKVLLNGGENRVVPERATGAGGGQAWDVDSD